jgi:hypothetical protein
VRVLLDGNLPRHSPRYCRAIERTRRISDGGRIWTTGPLLDAAEREYDAFVTMDHSLRFQQNLSGRKLRIVVIRAVRNTLPVLAPLAPAVLDALSKLRPGELRTVEEGE